MSSTLDSKVPYMKIYATGRNVATRNSKKTNKNDKHLSERQSKRPMHICPVLGYNYRSDWLNVWNVKGNEMFCTIRSFCEKPCASSASLFGLVLIVCVLFHE